METNKKSLRAEQFDKQRFFKDLSNAFGLGFSIALPITGGAVLGFIIDNKNSSHPRWTLSLLFTGIFIAGGVIYNIIKETKEG